MRAKCGPQCILRDSGWDQIWHFQTKDHQRASAWGDCDLFGDGK